MLIQISRPALSSGRHSGSASGPLIVVPQHAIMSPLRKAAQRLMMTSGIAAMAALALLFFKPELADHLKLISPFGPEVEMQAEAGSEPVAASEAQPAPVVPVAAQDSAILAEQKRVTQWISKRYRVSTDATNMLVSAAYATAQELKFDPLLILAVIAIESRFNPFAESPVGAQGLMQVMSKIHQEKFEDHGGVQAALNPVANIKVGTQILKDYIKRGGSVEAGLKRYVGAANFDTDFGYGAKVLGEYNRLKAIAYGKKGLTGTPAKKQELVQNSASKGNSLSTNQAPAGAGNPV